jgi:hypothetical protein
MSAAVMRERAPPKLVDCDKSVGTFLKMSRFLTLFPKLITIYDLNKRAKSPLLYYSLCLKLVAA